MRNDYRRGIDAETAAAELERQSKDVERADLQSVADRERELEDKATKGALRKHFEDIKTMAALVKDYASGEYREIPWKTMAMITAALIYVLNPLDLIPDFIPVLGQVDDALVVAACLMAAKSDVRTYREWRQVRDAQSLAPASQGITKDRLEQLDQLRNDGLLSETEFHQKRRQIIDEL